MSTTRATLRADVYTILNEPSTGGLYSDDLINVWLNNTQVEVCDGKKLKFLRSKYQFLAPTQTTLTSAITTASTTLPVADTTNYATSGAVWCQGDIILYTGKTSTTLTGCTGIDLAHVSGAYVYPLISLPTNYWSMPELRIMRSTTIMSSNWMYYDELEWEQRLSTHAFTFVISSDGTKYMMIDGVQSTDICVFHYQKYPTYMSSDSSVATIPDPYARKVIPTMTASKIMLLFGDDIEGLGTKLGQIGQTDLFKMYKHYGSAEEGFRGIFRSQYKSVAQPKYNSYTARS